MARHKHRVYQTKVKGYSEGNSGIWVMTKKLCGMGCVETASENVSEKRGEKAAAGDPDCTDFRIDTNNISAYLRQASMISRNDFMHVVEWASCQARGSIAFADGTHGKWRVQQYGVGMLLHGEEATYLYCHDCAKRFMPD